MGRIKTKNHFPVTVLFLALAGCATHSSDNSATETSPSPEPAAPLAATGSEPPSTTLAAETAKFPDAAVVAEPTAVPEQAALEPADAPNPVTNIWERVRAGFALPPLDSPYVAQHEQWFASNPEYMQRKMERARLYLHYIVEEVEKRGMPMEIALLPAIESAYQPYAYSRARAVGLWQFISPTARVYGLKMNWWYDGRRDVEASTQAALDYLEKLHKDFNGDWQLALAAYNAGEGKVMRMMDYNRRKGLPTDYPHLNRLKAETRHYVPKLMAFVNIVKDPAKYGVELLDITNEPYFAKVEIDSQVDLGLVAKAADMPLDELHSINAGFTRWATDPDGPHRLFVPVEKKEAVEEALSNLPPEERVRYRHHRVRSGDTLYDISRRYGVDVHAIRTANRLHGNLLHIGQSLIIPVSSRAVRAGAVTPTATAVRVASTTQPHIHRVRRGDTLWSIARRYNVMLQQLVEWNELDLDDVLRLGQRLKIWSSGGPSAALGGSLPSS